MHSSSLPRDWATDTRHHAGTPAQVRLNLLDLEPPEPLRRALEALATLPRGSVLFTLTRFRPVHLFSILDERGLSWETRERPDGTWESSIVNGPLA